MTTPTTISDIADLYRIIAEHPHWREALRNQLLGAEILAMPEILAQLAVKVDRLTEATAENSRQIAENSRQIAELRRISENQTLRMNRMESDIGDLKSMFTEAHPEETAREIADLMELSAIAVTSREVLRRIAEQLQLPYPTRRSFTRADLVFQAQDRHGIVHWYAAEISWTIAPRDLERARRNAQFLQEATGTPAQAVVCGYRYEDNMDWSGVHWLDLGDD